MTISKRKRRKPAGMANVSVSSISSLYSRDECSTACNLGYIGAAIFALVVLISFVAKLMHQQSLFPEDSTPIPLVYK